MTARPLAAPLFAGLAPLLAAAPISPTPIDPPPRGIVCPKTAATPTIDGKLDDATWAAAPWSDDFADIEGIDKPKPRHRTRVKLLWDDAALYIAAELDQPHVWTTIQKHDAVVFNDPDFEVFLDPDGDGHNYAELNALNTTWDLLLPKPYKDGSEAIDAREIAGRVLARRGLENVQPEIRRQDATDAIALARLGEGDLAVDDDLGATLGAGDDHVHAPGRAVERGGVGEVAFDDFRARGEQRREGLALLVVARAAHEKPEARPRLVEQAPGDVAAEHAGRPARSMV